MPRMILHQLVMMNFSCEYGGGSAKIRSTTPSGELLTSRSNDVYSNFRGHILQMGEEFWMSFWMSKQIIFFD